MPSFNITNTVFIADSLSLLMATLIVFVAVNVFMFSKRYMSGDRYYLRHITGILLLGASVLTMVFADHFAIFLAAWGVSNLVLVRLMTHKKAWGAAYYSGALALITFTIGFLCLAVSFWLLCIATGSTSIYFIIQHASSIPGMMLSVVLTLITLAAMTQSGIWPFHRWLLSSLNSPTPISALMHAGLVNGGGFLLVRFSALFFMQPVFLKVLFVCGLFTAIVGTFFKLLQSDIKRMLACSTMGQMGFMVAQCGMGLFAGAVSHLIWHGLFKAYLFLASGSVLHEQRYEKLLTPVTLPLFLLSCVVGVPGALCFAYVSGIALDVGDTSAIMMALAFMAAVQISCAILQKNVYAKLPFAFFASLSCGMFYGLNIRFIEVLLRDLQLWQPQPLDSLYVIGFGIIVLIWLVLNFNLVSKISTSAIWKRLYMIGLNASQPNPKTITTIRKHYQY